MLCSGPWARRSSKYDPAAAAAIEQSDVIVGYDLYVQLIAPLTQGKQVLSTPMKKEEERCRMAVELARSGKTVAMVCSGDPGVYGMAGILIEVAAPYPEVEVEAVPGITAAVSCAAVLGAPLIHDFAVISLSDLLTPWEKIEKRLLCAAQADFVLCLYNPSSKKRADYLRRACELVLQFQPPGNLLRLCAQYWPGRAGNAFVQSGAAEKLPGGYVYHRHHRQQSNQTNRKSAGNPQRVSAGKRCKTGINFFYAP